ncbi:MAG: hypothetical protein ABJF04_22335 [Reichenbachiella sp.]|uniref:hypothetical protein n=1 Tax=Reichenbachiella sp. TaxID=2184521 RepID=UPI0032645EC8
MMLEKVKLVFCISIVLTATSCWHEDGAIHHVGHQTINEQLNARSVDSIQYAISSEEYLKDLDKVKVDGIHGEVYIPNRSNHLNSFPCSSCHTKPLNELGNLNSENSKKAHWNIKLQHAEAEVMNCITCHNDSNLDQLRSLTGREINVNHSYKLCSQCHATQHKEWQGGAHGKRLGGWAPPRIINSCVNCHNPHSPAFESRWPARLNTVKLIEQTAD